MSGFYKMLTGPIYLERRTVDSGTELSTELAAKYNQPRKRHHRWQTNQWNNAGDGEILGIELAFERN